MEAIGIFKLIAAWIITRKSIRNSSYTFQKVRPSLDKHFWTGLFLDSFHKLLASQPSLPSINRDNDIIATIQNLACQRVINASATSVPVDFSVDCYDAASRGERACWLDGIVRVKIIGWEFEYTERGEFGCIFEDTIFETSNCRVVFGGVRKTDGFASLSFFDRRFLLGRLLLGWLFLALLVFFCTFLSMLFSSTKRVESVSFDCEGRFVHARNI
jgi:hypothetical protein